MEQPIWRDFESVAGPRGLFMGQWRGIGRTGREITVPCCYTQKDADVNGSDGLAALKSALKDNGLHSWATVEADDFGAGT